METGSAKNYKCSYNIFCNVCKGEKCTKLYLILEIASRRCLCVTKKGHSFFVINCKNKFVDNMVAIVFYTGHLNITGVKSKLSPVTLLPWIHEHLFNSEIGVVFLSIDNITYSFATRKTLNVPAIYNHFVTTWRDVFYAEGVSFVSAKYEPRRFASTFLKFSTGCISVFRSGKCVIVGSKRIADCIQLEKIFRLELKCIGYCPAEK